MAAKKKKKEDPIEEFVEVSPSETEPEEPVPDPILVETKVASHLSPHAEKEGYFVKRKMTVRVYDDGSKEVEKSEPTATYRPAKQNEIGKKESVIILGIDYVKTTNS
jgi:hypothetical protein